MRTKTPSPLAPRPRSWRPVLALVTAAALTGCATTTGPGAPAPGFTILAINDVYRIEGTDGGAEGGLSRVRHLRRELEQKAPDLLVLHAGDMFFPSLPSRLYDGEQMVDVLNYLDGDGGAGDDRMFATFGNHEFDQDKVSEAPIVRRRVEQSQFRWLDSNIEWTADGNGVPLVAADNLVSSAVVESGGVRVGLFSLTTDFKHPAYVDAFADPIAVARERTARLRGEGADVVVALTHQPAERDIAMLRTLRGDGPDLVIGGHEHSKVRAKAGGRWLLKADAEALSAVEVRVTPRRGRPPRVRFEYHELDHAAPRDREVDARVDFWLSRFDREYCPSIGREPGCLEEVVGRTRVELTGEELEIRRFETNYGNWIVDQARLAFAEHGAQIAFVNSGGLRLNRNIPPGEVRLEHIEETFQYPSGLVLVKITGKVLQEIVDHAVTDWRGNGKWLQVSGFAFRHDPGTASATDLTLLTAEGPRPVSGEEEILAVVNDYLATPGTGQDGYTMIKAESQVPVEGEVPSLRQLVIQGLDASRKDGIAPRVEGRICNTERRGPCLAIGDDGS